MKIAGGKYYAICLDLRFSKILIIWIGDDLDTVLTDGDKKIIAFDSLDKLKLFADSSSIFLEEGSTNYDTYIIQQWMTAPHDRIDCELFLDHWNLFIDIAESLNVLFIGDVKNDIRNSVYDKLFDGAGLFISENPNPVFTYAEILELSLIMQDGFNHLFNNLSVNK